MPDGIKEFHKGAANKHNSIIIFWESVMQVLLRPGFVLILGIILLFSTSFAQVHRLQSKGPYSGQGINFYAVMPFDDEVFVAGDYRNNTYVVRGKVTLKGGG